MLDVASCKAPTADPDTAGSHRIAAPWILGLYSLAGATFVVAARMAGWYGGSQSQFLVLPFAAVLGGLTQLLAGMWAFEAADALATAMLGTWGSFWIGYGILNVLFLSGRLAEPIGPFHELGFWFIPLALITWMGAAAAGNAALANLTLHGELVIVAGWLFVISSVLGWYTATAMLFETISGRQIWPVGHLHLRMIHRPESLPDPAPATRRVG